MVTLRSCPATLTTLSELTWSLWVTWFVASQVLVQSPTVSGRFRQRLLSKQTVGKHWQEHFKGSGTYKCSLIQSWATLGNRLSARLVKKKNPAVVSIMSEHIVVVPKRRGLGEEDIRTLSYVPNHDWHQRVLSRWSKVSATRPAVRRRILVLTRGVGCCSEQGKTQFWGKS